MILGIVEKNRYMDTGLRKIKKTFKILIKTLDRR